MSAGNGLNLRSNVEKMNSALRHRGPDGEGVFVDDDIVLGHRRLAIIDLSSSAHQPMADEEGRTWVVFNGEIYNYSHLKKSLETKGYVFRSESDTEVIVRGYLEWGEGIFARLEGMFAIGLWDAQERWLYLARDGCGIKPLFFSSDSNRVVFSSEIKGILASGLLEPEVNFQGLSDYLSLFYVPAPDTILKNVRQLEPGSFLRIGLNGNSRIQKFWDLADADEQVFRDPGELHDLIRQEASTAVLNALVADVPISLLLSSGLDSSVILTELEHCGRSDVETLTIGFEEESYDEGVVAGELAEDFGFSNRQVLMDRSDISGVMSKLVYHLDMLNANPCVLAEYFYFKEVARTHKVTLMGSGNDELFAGYPTYVADAMRKPLDMLPMPIRRWMATQCRRLPASDRKYAFEYLAKKFTAGCVYGRHKSHYWWRTIFEDVEKDSVLNDSLVGRTQLNLDAFAHYDRIINRVHERLSFEDQMLYADFNLFLIDNANCEVDQISMAFSLEARPPFLSKRFASFAFGIPYSEKLRNRKTKYCLRQAYKDRLPQHIINRKKHGLVAPLYRIFEDREFVNDHLFSSRMEEYFDKEYVELLLKEQHGRRHNHSYKLYALLTFAIWESLFIGGRH